MSGELFTAMYFSSISVLIMVALSVIAYMASKIFNTKSWLAFSKEEAFQVGLSIILIFVIIGGCYAIFGIIDSMTGMDPYEGASNYLLTVQSDANEGLQYFFVAKYGINLLSSFVIPSDPLTSMLGNIPILDMFIEFSAKRPMLDMSTFDTAMQYLLFTIIWPMFASLITQNVGLILIKNLTMTFILPMGLFLRVFPMTRQAGAFLIATAIAFFLVFPTTYLLHGIAYEEIKDHNELLLQGAVEQSLDETKYDSTPVIGEIWKVGINSMKMLMKFILVPILSFISLLIFAGIFLPTLSIIITITFIKTMQKIIGMGFS